MRGAALLGVVLALGAGCRKQAPAPLQVRVAAAADLSFAFQEIGAAFERDTGQKVVFSFGSTGPLARQIAEGAPFDLFAAANVSFVRDVVKAGACDGATQALYGRGRIGVWTRKAGGVRPPERLDDLSEGRFVKIAIANPEHAPYGRAAKEALLSAGLWERLQPRIVHGENVQQALKFAQTGNAEAAIVAVSLATVTKDGDVLLIDDALHKALDQALVVCGRGGNAAGGRAFAAFVASAAGRATMRRYGFVLPDEGPPVQ